MPEAIRSALDSLLANKTRSALTMIGIVVGVGAVIAMTALALGAAAVMDEFISGRGANVLLIFPGTVSSGGARGAAGSAATLTFADTDALRGGIFIDEVLPETYGGAQLVWRNKNWNTTIVGSTPGVLEARSHKIEHGEAFSDMDVTTASKVCILGATVARNLFGDEYAVGRVLRIKNVPFRVVAVLKAKGPSPWGSDQDDLALTPVTTAQRRLFRSAIPGTLKRVTVRASDKDTLSLMKEETRAILRQRHRLPAAAADDFVIYDMTQTLEDATASTRVMGLLLGAVASISLLIGGVGIMNIMLVSVQERTGEIGIRMAVGARSLDVQLQFLAEAVILSLSGGAVGIALGMLASRALTERFGWPTLISAESVLTAFGFSAFVGVFFGLWPAWRASRLNVVDALRHE
ncbi:ABC transporter permease [Synergistales bacterium]|nr:ABC transporter permease [Synergistales bacterium]